MFLSTEECRRVFADEFRVQLDAVPRLAGEGELEHFSRMFSQAVFGTDVCNWMLSSGAGYTEESVRELARSVFEQESYGVVEVGDEG